jgi:murein DD-endopeptidase MepM/ murein hydrolase activator NlpD
MSSGSGLPRSWICARVLAVALIGVGAAGCSAEPERFDDSGYSQTTGSIQPGQRFASASLRPPLPIPEAPLTAAVVSKGGSRNHDRMDRAATTTARVSAPPVAMGKPPIKISKRDGGSVSVGTKMANIARPAKPRSDQVVLRSPSVTSVPGKHGSVAGEQPPVRPAQGPAAVVPAPDIPTSTVPASTVPASTVPAAAAPAAAAPAAAAPAAAAPAAAAPAAAAPAAAGPAATGPSKTVDAAPTFHWPVRGQVIAGFGSKINGQPNYGINVAVPEDTAIKAADDGVVVYSGNQLKSYGNLLLVRHPNGYVTVYAHAKQLLVKGGDEIKRGQVIAKAGRTGEVDSPQVHFEIRKASAPVDPMPYLNGA